MSEKIVILFVIMLMFSASVFAEPYKIEPRTPKIAPRFQQHLYSLDKSSPVKIWVFFTDKNLFDKSSVDQAAKTSAQRFSDRCKERRELRTESKGTFDYFDIPVFENYLNQVGDCGLNILRVSRWLNAAVGYADREVIEKLIELEFVAEIRPVAKGKRAPEPPLFEKGPDDIPDEADYGLSFKQLDLINILLIHQLNFSGAGVMVAVFDGGFSHHLPVFNHLRVVDTFDFVHNDTVVTSDDSREVQHGTSVLSVIGGFAEGTLIGAAYNADYLLAETEDDYVENITEEHNWIAAAEWADSLGADIITSSVGYLDWYEYPDVDGLTAPITVAADIAVSRGISVFNAAGNERCSNPDNCFFWVTPPADGFHVIGVGAVDSFGVIAPFSSSGPTYDGRVKPDIVAMGVNVYTATWDGNFQRRGGTSFSTPLAAGAAALMLDIDYSMTPAEIKEALILSADRADSPDTLYGYGLIDAFRASRALKIVPHENVFVPVGQWREVSFVYSKPLNAAINLTAENLPLTAEFTPHPGVNGGTGSLYYVGKVEDIGTFDVDIILSLDGADPPLADTMSFQLRVDHRSHITAGPNPFRDSLAIYLTPSSGEIQNISVHTINGEKVRTNLSDTYNSSNGSVIWDGNNDRGLKVASGVYFIIVRTLWTNEKIKVFKL